MALVAGDRSGAIHRAGEGRYALAASDRSGAFPRAWKGRHALVERPRIARLRRTGCQVRWHADSNRSAPITLCQAACAVRVVGPGMLPRLGSLLFRPTSRSGAAYHKQPIGGLPPSACLPFQARGEASDRLLASSTYLPFQAREEAPNWLPASSTCPPFRVSASQPNPNPGTHGAPGALPLCHGERTR